MRSLPVRGHRHPRSFRSWRPLRSLWLMVSLSFEADPKGAALLCVSGPAGYLAPTAGALATKQLVDAVVSGRPGLAVVAASLAGLAVLGTLGNLLLVVYLIHAIGKKVDALVERRLVEQLVRLPGIEHYERADCLDEVQLLRDQAGMLGAGLNATVQMVAQMFQVVVVCSLLGALAPVLLLLPLFAIPSFVAASRSNALNRRAMERTAESDRLLHRIVGLVTEPPVAREARLFRFGTELRARRRRLASTIDRTRGQALARSTWLGWTGDLIFALGYTGAVMVVLRMAIRGEVSAGDVALTVVLAGQVQGFLGGLVRGARFVAAVHIVAARMDWFEAYEREQRPAERPGPLSDMPARLRRGIRLDQVSFRYPGTEAKVLEDISCELPTGAVVALVGDNGAGKSSLVKLLLRYYEPTQGRILVDETPLADLDLDHWRARASGAFQDLCRLEFLARESIGLGDVGRIDDDRAVRQAAGRAGAAEVVDALPQGLGTQLGAGWPDGIDLSGGQWQRVALARARMRERPLLLVLDEPTAALDVEAEHALFERFIEAARDIRETGGVTLLVTHRFSTVRMADLILVLDGGRIRESGTHDELVAAGSLYAELYDLQARAYR